MAEMELVTSESKELIARPHRKSLGAWLQLYMAVDGSANADATVKAKLQDLDRFYSFFQTATRTDAVDSWTRSVSESFFKQLRREKSEKTGRKLAPTTVNRILATLRKAARWIQSQRPFLAGYPMDGIKDIQTPEPVWQGLTELEMTRLKSAAQQLLKLSTRKNQQPHRDYAILQVLHCTGLRVHELLKLELEQFTGKHVESVQRKGRNETPKVFLAKPAREALSAYIKKERGDDPGPLFRTRTGKALTIQHVQYILNRIAGQANATLPKKEHIHIHPHLLRHTMLRQVAEEKGERFAREVAGHVSNNYIRLYTMPSPEEQEDAIEDIFG